MTTFTKRLASVVGLGALLSFQAHAQTYSKTETVEYHDDLSLWVLGQVERVTLNGPVNVNGVVTVTDTEAQRTDFGWKALPWKTYSFGKLQQTLSYDSTSTVASGQLGTIKTVSDGRDGTLDTTITLSNWKRGIPQSIKYPATAESPTGAIQSTAVNDDGTIASITDENGYTTGYEYDDMGRLAKIVYPQEVASTKFYNDTVISFVPTTAQFGLGAGHWAQVITQGAYRKITHFDALWRPMMVQEEGGAGTARFTAKAYDLQGNEAFNGYPQATGPVWNGSAWMNGTTPMKGTRATSDALNRITRVEQDSELDLNQDGALDALVTTTAYLSNASGPYTLVTNPRTKQTRTWFQMFDQPDYSKPVTIWHPEGAYTHITRDVFGKPMQLRRSNSSSPTGGTVAVNRTFTYDAYQQLCRTVEPETGATLIGYDAAGNLLWNASGLPAATACDTEGDTAAILARKASRTYDGRNRVTSLSFPGGLGDTIQSYTPDGLLASVTADNGSTDQVATTYTYNHRRLLTKEQLLWGNLNWSLLYGYNTNGHLSSQTSPGNVTVDYAPNALGQATQAGTYATGVSYFPNGAIKQFTYGNGVVHTLTQNARGLPDTSKDAYSTTSFLADSYDYDPNGNVAAITDGATNRNQRGNRTMTYDGLDRLTRVVSPMYGSTGGNYTYDELDNLTRTNIGGVKGRDNYYCYDAATQRLTFLRNGPICTGTSANEAVGALEYDVQGNLSAKDGFGFTFDFGNRLRNVKYNGSYVSTYIYDGFGRRVRDYTTASKYSLYSQSGQLAFTSNGRTSTYAAYVYLGGSLVATREWPHDGTTATIRYQHTDALGSPVTVTDASRNILERNEYEPYGKVIAPAAPKDGPGFTGHVYDAATGMNYMQQRYYDSGIGRFLSVDPVSANSSTGENFNRYRYANNNPYKFTDPDGRQSRENVYVPSTGVPFLDWLMTPSDARGSFGQMMAKQFGFEFSQPHSAEDIVLYTAVAMSAGTGAAGGGLRSGSLVSKTEVVQRAMSRAELRATESTGLLRGGRNGTHYVSDAVNSDALRARQRLALPQTPEVRATLEVPAGRFSKPSRVDPAFNMPGGGMERTATEKVPARILKVDDYPGR